MKSMTCLRLRATSKLMISSDVRLFHPFVNLPPRSLTDYYRAIKRPLSLQGLKKKVRGQHGRDAPTDASDFKSWDAMEEEALLIWTNAWEYNEDGSEMYELANQLEVSRHHQTHLTLLI